MMTKRPLVGRFLFGDIMWEFRHYVFGGVLLVMLGSALLVAYRHWVGAPVYNPHLWVTGYLPAYRHQADKIAFMRRQDYAMLTHIAHASAVPRVDGTLDIDTNVYLPEYRRQAVNVAEAVKRPILLVLTGPHEVFNAAMQPGVRDYFIQNILQLLDSDGYDGVDLNMEPVTRDEKQENPDYVAFVRALHKALQTRESAKLGRPPLLTAAVAWRDRHVMAEVEDAFDQINLMTYDMAQPHPGWVTWFDAAVSNGGETFPAYPVRRLPSLEDWVAAFVDAGIPRRKLGIGISFDVACWQGGIAAADSQQGMRYPRQVWQQKPHYFKRSYAEMQQTGLLPPSYQWDGVAQMAWFSLEGVTAADDNFCNFNDARAIAAKVEFARQQGLGGVIVWELALDHLPDSPQSPPLRQALGDALGWDGGNLRVD